MLNTTAFTMILGGMEQAGLLNAYNFSSPRALRSIRESTKTLWGGPSAFLANTTTTCTLIATFICPSDVVPTPYSFDPNIPSPYPGYNAVRLQLPLAMRPVLRGTSTPGSSRRLLMDAPLRRRFSRGPTGRLRYRVSRMGRARPAWSSNLGLKKAFGGYGGYWGQGLWTSTHALVYDSNPSNSESYSMDWTSTMPNGVATLAQFPNNPRKLGYAWSVGSTHPGGLNAGFSDGSVRFIKTSIAPSNWFARKLRTTVRSSTPTPTNRPWGEGGDRSARHKRPPSRGRRRDRRDAKQPSSSLVGR